MPTNPILTSYSFGALLITLNYHNDPHCRQCQCIWHCNKAARTHTCGVRCRSCCDHLACSGNASCGIGEARCMPLFTEIPEQMLLAKASQCAPFLILFARKRLPDRTFNPRKWSSITYTSSSSPSKATTCECRIYECKWNEVRENGTLYQCEIRDLEMGSGCLKGWIVIKYSMDLG